MCKIDFSPENKYIFLIGNGLNIAMGNNKCSWDRVLWDIASQAGQKALFTQEDGNPKALLSSPETFNAIQIYSDHEIFAENIVAAVKVIKFQRDKKSSLLTFAEKNNIDILTTNFDMNMERYLWNCDYKKLKFSCGAYYPWEKYYSAADFDSCSRSTSKIWHIHGDITQNRSILFSMTRYMRAARKTVELLNDNKDNYAALKKTWVWKLLSCPLIIAGLGLAEQEIFLRWLLIERLMSAKRLKLNSDSPKSYYLYRCDESKDIEKLGNFLRIVNITPVCVGKDIFDSPIWDAGKQVIQLPEVEK